MYPISTSFWKKTIFTSTAWVGIMLLSGCTPNQAANQITLNIGYQNMVFCQLSKTCRLNALKNQNVKINWVEFPAGPQL